MEKVMAFAFSAGEFLEEEIDELAEKLGKDHEFIKEGKCRIDKTKQHPYQWWTTQAGCDAVNKLYKSTT